MVNNMKSTGKEWIGKIPNDWKTKKIKYLSVLNGRIGWQGLTSEEYTDEGAFLITGTDFKNGSIDWNNCVHVSMKRWKQAKDIQIKNGDLLITKDGTVGKVAIVTRLDSLASLNSGVLKINTFNDFNRNFLYYILLSDVFWVWFENKNAGNSTIIHLYQNDFAEFEYPIPDISEQKAIASFLDNQCKKIDSIIADMDKQIEILKQYKISLITETVTKGLNKNAPMKNSGIDWIGKIPEHWKMGRIKYCFNIILGKMLQPNQERSTEKEMNYMCSVNVTWDGINLSTVKQMWFSPSEIRMYLLKKGDLLVTEGGDIAVACFWNNELQECCIQNALHVIKNNEKHLNEFLYYWLYFIKHTGYIDLVCNKATIAHFTKDKFGESPICVIPIEEQRLISNYLDEKLVNVNQMITAKQQSIDTMKAYKKSLIYEYVTGKNRVKGYE